MRRSYNDPQVIEISFKTTDGPIIKRFHNCWELRQYFLDNPPFADLFGFVPRSRLPESKTILEAMWECLKEFGDSDFTNNLNGHDRGRIACQDAMFIAKHAEGYYLTDLGKNYIGKMKPIMSKQ